MAIRETKTLSFTPQQASFVEGCIASGRYQSASEVVRAGLRLLADEEKARSQAVKTIQDMIEVGASQLEAGQVKDGQAVFDDLAAELDQMEQNS